MAFIQDFFALFGAARFTNANGAVFPIAASMAGESHERRLVARKRPYVEGAPLDDTGSEPDAYDLQILFANGHGNPNVPDPAYPDYHRRFMREAFIEGTGTLYYPGLGEIRCRLKRIASRKSATERDCETVDCVFWADNEDGRASIASFNLPSARSGPPVLGARLLAGATAVGAGGDLLGSLAAAIGKLSAAVSAPFDSAAQIALRSASILDTLGRTERRLVNGPRYYGPDAYSPLADVAAGPVLASMALLADATAKQMGSAQGSNTVVARRFTRDLSIFAIAQQLGQDASELVRLNADQPAMYRIPAGTAVWVKAA